MSADGDFTADSTRRMAKRLQRIHAETDPLLNLYQTSPHIEPLRRSLSRTNDLAEKVELQQKLADALLFAGKNSEALEEYEKVEKLLSDHNIPLQPNFEQLLLMSKAVCHLREAEMANCMANHNADSCLFPLQGGGIHTLKEGSRAAYDLLARVLEKSLDEPNARWLLNIVAMTLGEYPDGIPEEWLIDPALFESDFKLERFPDMAAQAGLVDMDLAGGVIMDDFDNDGLLDLFVTAWGIDSPTRFYRNRGDESFEEHSKAAGLTGETGGLNCLQADYNNDGYMDALILRGAWLGKAGYYPNSLMRNNGDETFTDVTEEAGMMSFHPTQTAVWMDYDNDGWIDLFVANEATPGDSHACELFRNNGDGTFTNKAREVGLDLVGFFKGTVSADYNNDGLPDLYLSSQEGANQLFRNDGADSRGRWHFSDVSRSAGVDYAKPSFSCWFWDYDNDGWEDIYVNGYELYSIGDQMLDYMGKPHRSALARLYRNNGDGTFSDVSHESGVDKLLYAMGANFGDLDNDGRLDFYIGTGDPQLMNLMPSRMFRQGEDGRFQDVTTSGGFGQLQKGHGIAFGDLDNDGDQDIYSVVGGAAESDGYPDQLFANPGNGNSWIKLRLVGVQSNRAAIGARVTVVAKYQNGDEREFHRTVGSGGSFGASPMRVEIGLGNAVAIDRIEIFWPVSARRQIFTDAEINQSYRVSENSTDLVAWKSPSFELTVMADAPQHHQ